MIPPAELLLPAPVHVGDIGDEEPVRHAAAHARRAGGVVRAEVDRLGTALRAQDIEALLHVELAAAAPVADAVGAEAEASDLKGEHARAQGVQRSRGHTHEIALGHRDAAAVLLADGVVGRGRAQGIYVVGGRPADDRRAGLGLHDVPGLGLLVVVLVGLGIRFVGVDLHRKVLPRAHGDDLDDAVPLEVAHDL